MNVRRLKILSPAVLALTASRFVAALCRRGSTRGGRLAAIALLPFLVPALQPGSAWAEEPYQVEWIRQLDTGVYGAAGGGAVDAAGNVLIVGNTDISIGGPNAGSDDAFVVKYDTVGGLLWSRQLGTTSSDGRCSVAGDTLGNVFITGATKGSLGGPNAGSDDTFVAKYDAAGNLAWTRQFGTDRPDYSNDIATDSLGNVFVVGSTTGSLGGPNAGGSDAFVAKYDAAGSLAWIRQFGTNESDDGNGIATDSAGNVFITGDIQNSLFTGQAFVAKYDAAGNFIWSREFGTAGNDESFDIATDSGGNLFVAGATSGSLGGANAGSYDAFLARYDANGNEIWTRQLGTDTWDGAYGVAADLQGNVFITGTTNASGPSATVPEVLVAKYDADGNRAWFISLGTDSIAAGEGIAADAAGNLFIVGNTSGSLGAPNPDGVDAFVVKLAIPEPASAATVVLGLVLLSRRRRAA